MGPPYFIVFLTLMYFTLNALLLESFGIKFPVESRGVGNMMVCRYQMEVLCRKVSGSVCWIGTQSEVIRVR